MAALASYLSLDVRMDTRSNMLLDIQDKNKMSIFLCPGEKDSQVSTIMQSDWGEDQGLTDYAANEGVSGWTSAGWRIFGNERRIKDPSSVMLFSDGQKRTEWSGRWCAFYTGNNNNSTLYNAFNFDNGCGTPSVFDFNRHRSRMNILLVDGHAEGIRIDEKDLSEIGLSEGLDAP